MVDVEYLMFEVGKFVEDSLHSARLRVGEEHLTETITTNQSYKLFDTHQVEFIENIVEQQYRFLTRMVKQVLELCQFQRQCETLLLPL